MQLRADKEGVAQWFYDRGQGFREADSVVAALGKGENIVSFTLPSGLIRDLRFDPINNTAEVTVERLRLDSSLDPQLGSIDAGQLVPLANIAGVHQTADGISIVPSSTDPQLRLVLQRPLDLRAPSPYPRNCLAAVLLTGIVLLVVQCLRKARLARYAVPAAMAFVFGLILAMAGVATTSNSVHPDEFSHLGALHFYIEHWVPPAIDDPSARPAMSVYGYSYLFELNTTYMIASWVVSPFVDGVAEVYAARAFQALLWALLCILAFRARAFAMPLGVLLVSPQVWYVFSYFNSDAFGLFVAMIAALMLCFPGNSVGAYLSGKRKFGIHVVAFGTCLGLLLISKPNFVILVPAFLLWLGVLHLDLRWYELASALLALAVFGTVLILGTAPVMSPSVKGMLWLAGGIASALAGGSLLIRCTHVVQCRNALSRMFLLCLIAGAVAAPRVAQDIFVNGFPGEKAARIVAAEETNAGAAYKPSTIATGQGGGNTGLVYRGVGMEQMLFAPPYRWLAASVQSFFGVYGYMNIVPPLLLNELLALIFLLVAATAAFTLARTRPAGAHLVAVAAGTCALVALSSILNSWVLDFQPQGRYLLPGLAMLVLVIGWAQSRLPRKFVGVLMALAFALSAWSFACIALPAFASHA